MSLQIRTKGRSYSDWLSVTVQKTYNVPVSEFSFAAAEMTGKTNNFADLKLKPGDEVEIRLAGQKAFTGYIIARNVGFDARQHALILQGLSKTTDIVASSARPAEFNGYGYEPIVRSVLKPFPIKLIVKNPPPGLDRQFSKVRVQPGESVWEFIERLSRQRGMILTDDADGNLVASQIDRKAKPVAALQEGFNILSARATLNDDSVMHKVWALGPDRGNDQRNGKTVAKVAAVAENPSARPWREQRILSEEPGSVQDMQTRADHEVARQIYTSVSATIVVQGWLRPDDGKLWDVTENVTVKSPMIFATADGTMDLGIQSVTFGQDAQNGTTTTLQLCLPSALSTIPDPGVKGAVPDLLSSLMKHDVAKPLSSMLPTWAVS